MSFNKLFLSLILLIILFCSLIQPAAALSDLAGEGLDIVAEIANSQDAAAGIKNFSKDQYNDWLWEAAGGYENLITGNLGKSQINQIKGKFDTIQTVINGITEFALAVDAGRYDEALYQTLETTVNTVDHPLVSATWAAAKLTYQSHQMVKDTKAETEIARLFYMMHKDRRLFSAEEGEMKQIPVNSDTVDYFFNKYIVTDPSGRTMVRAYVEQRLGEEWPEESWGSWLNNLRTIGAGIDTAGNEEVAALTGKYKNTARNWIRQLMEDVNLEAQRWYKEKELNKLMTEFEVFSREFGEFNSNIGDMISAFAKIKEIQAREDSYREILVESEKNYILVNKQFNNIKNTNKKRSVFSELYSETVKWENELTPKRRDISWAGMKPLADDYLLHIRNWHELRIKIFENLPPMINEPAAAYETTTEYKVEKIPKIFTILISGLLEEPEFIKNKSYIEQLKSEYLSKLKNTSSTDHYREEIWGHKNTLVDVDGLNRIINYEWGPYYNQCNEELKSISYACERRQKLYNRFIEGENISEASTEDREVVKRISEIAEAQVSQIISKYDSKYNKNPGDLFLDDGGNLINHPNPKRVIEYKKSVLSRGLVVQAKEAVNEAVVRPAEIYLRETDRSFRDRHNAVIRRLSFRKQQYDSIESKLDKIEGILIEPGISYRHGRRKEVALKGKLSFSITDWLESDREHYMEIFSYSPDINISSHFVDISSQLENYISSRGLSISSDDLMEREMRLRKVKSQVESVEKIWRTIEIPNGKEEEEIKELVNKDFSVKELKELGIEINRLLEESKQISPVFAKLNAAFVNYADDFQRHIQWVRDTAYRIELLFEDLESSGLIKANFMLNLPEGNAYIGENAQNKQKSEFDGMILTAKPYPHLMKESEISGLKSDIELIKKKFTEYNVYSFYNTYAKNSLKTLNDILDLKIISDRSHPPIKGATEDIIVHPAYILQGNTVEALAQAGNFKVIKESNLTEAEKILAEAAEIVEGEIDENYRLIKEKEFIDNIRKISKLLPLTAEVKSFPAAKEASVGGRVIINESGEKVMQEIKYLIKEESLEYLTDYTLAVRYKQFAQDLRDVFYKYNHRAEEEYRKETERLIPYDELAYRIEGAIDSVEFFIREKDYENALLYEEELEKLKMEHRDLPGEDPGSRCPELLEKLEKLIKEAENLVSKNEEKSKQSLNKINAFYKEFTYRYQSKDEYGVLSLLADDWESADGTTLWDLEETLIRNFRVFDNISFQITNLEIVEQKGNNQYRVTYQLKIISEIFDRNIRHEESSSVREIVEIKENGSGQILKTLGGRFWRE
jgi:hypothetical protein